MQIICAMGPPGGGRSVISERIQSRFNVINFTFPSNSQVQRIFQIILSAHLSSFSDDVKNLAETLTLASLELYKGIVETFLPTPSKCHYLFSLRDIAKTVQGILMSDKNGVDTRYISRICRILSQPRGNAMLVGVGGSGRQSLSKLAAFVAGQKVFRIKVSKRYGSTEFRD